MTPRDIPTVPAAEPSGPRSVRDVPTYRDPVSGKNYPGAAAADRNEAAMAVARLWQAFRDHDKQMLVEQLPPPMRVALDRLTTVYDFNATTEDR